MSSTTKKRYADRTGKPTSSAPSVLHKVKPGLKVGKLTVLRLIPVEDYRTLDDAFRVEAQCECGEVVEHNLGTYREPLKGRRSIACRLCTKTRADKGQNEERELINAVAKHLFERQRRAAASIGLAVESGCELAHDWREFVGEAAETIAQYRRGLELHLSDHTPETKDAGLNPMKFDQYNGGKGEL